MSKRKLVHWGLLVSMVVLLAILLSTIAATAGSPAPAATGPKAVYSAVEGPANIETQGPFTSEPVYPAVFNGDLRDLPQITPDQRAPIPLHALPGQEPSASQAAGWVDSVAQNEPGAGHMPSPIENFPGLDFNTFGSGWPPDTNGDVGPDHYIQTVNTSVGIYDKDTGTRLVGVSFDTFFTGPGGTPCDNSNQGDPVVIYDASVNRWVVTDFAWDNFNTGPYYECIAVSQGADPVAGGWYFYALRADTDGFTGYLNDYPKLSVWSDGWYMTANMFQINPPGPGFGVRVWALDRASMVAGGPLNEVHFDTCDGGACGGLLPSNYRGAAPPADSPNYVLGATAPDALVLFKFHVDWVTPGNSTFTGPEEIQVAPFLNVPQNSIPQPGTGMLLDSLGDRLMFSLQYRNRNGVESIWATHSVMSGGVSGKRWYEIQDPGGAHTLVQQGTYQPDDNYRWMGSLAVDQDGNMALGYSLSSTTVYPSILYAGRLAGETPGLLPQSEETLIAGTGSQTAIERWGDYSAMSVDPVDDCTFWYTQEYYITNGSDWQTRIGSFKFPSCGQPKGYLDGTVYNSVTNLPVPGVMVTAESVTTTLTAQTDASGYYTMTLMGDTYDVTAGPLLPGYPTPVTVPGIVVNTGSTTTQDFFLDPVPFLAGGPTTLDDNVPGGNNNGFPEPGESGLLLFEALENTGGITSTNIIAQLSALTPGVTVDQANTAYPDIPAGAAFDNLTPYAFSIDYLVPCGTDLDFSALVTDTVSTYTTNFTLNASVSLPREDVISNTVEAGPMGWTTGGTPNSWAITTLNYHSPTHSWTDSPGGDYNNNVDNYVRTPAINLSGKRNVRIGGWYFYDLETGYDYVYLEYSLNGGSIWNTSDPLTSFNGHVEFWENRVIDASQLDNQPNVALRWRLVSDAGVVFDGIYLDDVSVSYEPYNCVYAPPIPPGTPDLITPANGALVTSPVSFEWADSGTGDPATGYIFKLDGTPVMTFTTPVTSTTMTLTNGIYDWSVIATNDSGNSPESEVWSFEVVPVIQPPEPPGVPNLISPPDGAILDPGEITFTWEDSGTGGPPGGYVFQLDGTPVITFTTPITGTQMIAGPGPHTWSVKAYNESGESAYATPREFQVLAELRKVHLPLLFLDLDVCSNFFDDFSDPSSGWYTGEDSDGRFEYLNGEYSALVKPSSFYWLLGAPTCDRANYTVEVDARWTGNTGSSYGLIFGIQGDYEQFYSFEMNTDFQEFALLRYGPGGWVEIVPPTGSLAIHAGSDTNHLKATRNGDVISLEVNGTTLGSWSDSTITGASGTGLIISSYSDVANAEAAFDNFSVTRLDSSLRAAAADPDAFTDREVQVKQHRNLDRQAVWR